MTLGLNNMDHTKVLECSEFAKSLGNIQFTWKDKQVQCIGNILGNKHIISLVLTRYGKSMIYTLLRSYWTNSTASQMATILLS